MNKIIRYIQNYLLAGFPFMLGCVIWQTINPEINTNSSGMAHVLWEALSINLMLWFSVLILFLVFLVFIPSVKEKVLTRLSRLKERDEREQYITGQAARSSFISTLALTIFLLFFSLFSLQVSWDRHAPDRKGMVNISLGFSLLNESVQAVHQDKVLFDSRNIALSSSSLILILLCWQIGTFKSRVRKLSE